MTDDRSLERAARSWIEVGPTRAPDHAVDAALARIQTTHQERDWFPWRTLDMLTPTRLAVAAVLGVLLIGGALFTLARPPAVGGPGPSDAASPSPSAVASPSSAAIARVRLPDTVLGDWEADPATAIPGVSDAGERIQLSLDWDKGVSAWIQPEQGELSLHSDSIEAASGELRFRSTERLGGCTPGDEGRYDWERSADGMFLTLTVLEDACAARADAFGRIWVRSLGAVNDGGPGVIAFEPWVVSATLPAGRWGMGGPMDGPVITAYGENGPLDVEFTIIRNPMGFEDPCALTDKRAVPIDRTTTAIADHLASLPGISVTRADGTIDGRAAVHLTTESDAGVDCAADVIWAFHPPIATDSGEYTIDLGTSRSFWTFEFDGDVWVVWFAGDGVSAADEQAVIDSIRFLDRLPTP